MTVNVNTCLVLPRSDGGRSAYSLRLDIKLGLPYDADLAGMELQSRILL